MADGAGAKLVHVRVYASGVFGAKVGDVWDAVRNFGQAEAWLTGAQGVKTFTRLLPGQVNCQIGALRLVTIGQASYVDQLDALDDDRHVMKYKLVSHPLNTNPYPGAFLNFRAVIRLHGVTRGSGTFLEWTGDFDTEPQDSQVMRAAIAERLEAGFQGLELLFARPQQAQPAQQPMAGQGRPVGATRLPPHVEPAELARGVAAMGLRHTTSMPSQAQGWPQPQPNRSPRDAAGQRQRGAGGMHESNSGSSLASSPHHHDAAQPGQRPGSGSAGHTMAQWTSGGSGSTIHLSTIPTRVSGDQEDRRQAALQAQAHQAQAHAHAAALAQAQAQAQAQAAQAQARPRNFAGWVPDVPPAAHFNPTSVPSAAHVQGPQRQQANLAADLFQQYQRQQGKARQQGQAGGQAEAMDMQAGQLRQHASGEALRTHLPASRSQPPPAPHPMQEAGPAWTGQQAAHAGAQLQQQQQQPEAWAGGLHQPGSQGRGGGPSGRGGADNDADWARMMQQREDDLREAHQKQARSPGDRASLYGQAGPFGAAAMAGTPLAGGPFAAASGGGLESHLSAPGPAAAGGVRRTASHQSLGAMSHSASGALDRSAGSAQSVHAAEEQARRRSPASCEAAAASQAHGSSSWRAGLARRQEAGRSPFQQETWDSA